MLLKTTEMVQRGRANFQDCISGLCDMTKRISGSMCFRLLYLTVKDDFFSPRCGELSNMEKTYHVAVMSTENSPKQNPQQNQCV